MAETENGSLLAKAANKVMEYDKVIVIGSSALDLGNQTRVSKDYDLICTLATFKKIYISALKKHRWKMLAGYPYEKNHWIYVFELGGEKLYYDVFLPYEGSYEQIYHHCKDLESTKISNDIILAPLNLLYMIKLSHMYKKTTMIEFKKTMSDILVMEENGAVFDEKFRDVFDMRKKETYNYSHPKLNQSKNNFFTDDVPYIYDHDSIHLAVKNLEKPAYQYFKPEQNEVLCSKELFYKQDEKIKLLSVYEEACVLALERSIIPFNITEQDKIRDRFEYALMKVCTSITSGWFRKYAWRNYRTVMNMYNIDFYNNFLSGVESGIVKDYKND